MTNLLVKCCRCRNKHLHSERTSVPSKKFGYGVNDLVCPRCGCTSYYQLEEIKEEKEEG